jgi:hypothetical protein
LNAKEKECLLALAKSEMSKEDIVGWLAALTDAYESQSQRQVTLYIWLAIHTCCLLLLAYMASG